MIYTVTFNPSLDYVIAVEEFETGKINRNVSESIFPGGKGINVSSVLAEFQVPNTALGFIAGFTGEKLNNFLMEKNIHTDFIDVGAGQTRINIKLRSVDKEDNHLILEETEINGAGPTVSEDDVERLLAKIDAFTDEDIVVLSGSVSKGISQNIYADIVKLCCEKNIRVVVDATSALLWNALEYRPFLVKPNKDELEDIFYRDIFTKEEVIFYAKELQNKGARNVLVSLGEEGAILVAENGEEYLLDAPKGKVVNSVGAGDAMVAGFLAGYLERENFEYALKLGVCSGSATAFSEGLATISEIKALM